MSIEPGLEALVRLRADPRLNTLDSHVSPLRLFSALGAARDEVVHSRLLATLFDPRTHAGAETMLRALLTRIANRSETPAIVTNVIRNLPAAWDPILVRRELYHIDVIVDILAPTGLVVGIENKIDAGEGKEQLSRYQNFLRNRFRGRSAFMLFLTPTGRDSATAAHGDPVPCLPVSYKDVLLALEVARQQATGRDAAVLEIVATHLREEIVGEPDEIRKQVHDLWRAHPDALRLVVQHRPGLGDLRKYYEERVRKEFGSTVEFDYYPNRGNLREIKFSVPNWPERFPFTVMLHANDGPPQVRVLIYCDDYNQHEVALKKWAVEVNAENKELLDEDFRPLPGWAVWRRVFAEEDWPVASLINTGVFDDDTARAAVDRVCDLVSLLRPYVEPQPK